MLVCIRNPSLALGIMTANLIDLFHLGTLFRASQFLSEELPIRLAHRVQELSNLPDGLNEMPSIKKVQDWYAQSFEVRSYKRYFSRLTMTLTCDVRRSRLCRSPSCQKMSGIAS